MPKFTKAFLWNLLILVIAAFTTPKNSYAQLRSEFSASPLSGCSPQVVNFTDLSTGNPVEWRWDLGNGSTSVLQNPSATYFTAGQYSIKLVVKDASGNLDSLTKINYITISAIPVVNFSATPVSGCVPLAVQFTDESTAGTSVITNWLWDFGDGTTGTTQHPLHTYATAGNYNVTLRVTTDAGCVKTLTKTNFIQASNGVTANFTNTSPTGCSLPVTISFTNTSTGSGTLTYAWDFGDGGTSTLQHPVHTYLTSGSYNVRLVVTSSTGCNHSITKSNAVVISMMTASFTGPATACVNDTVSFINTTIPAPTSVLWRFGDGTTSTQLNPVKAYAATGTYFVKLITYLGACADSTIATAITILPKPTVAFTAANRSACKPPLTVNFSNTSTAGSTYTWHFGDGATSTATNPSHTYTTYGSFNVTLIVTNILGCTDSLVRSNYINISPPQASINNMPQSGCSPITWTFTSTVNSADPVVSYFWDLGDGTTSTAANPTNTYTTGSYDITLIVTTAGGCKDTIVYPAGIVASVKPTANFSADPRDVCAKFDVNFLDNSTGNITRWDWDFGDGGTSSAQNPSHQYEDTGFFTIRLIVWNNNCPDTLILVDYVHISPPIAAFAPAFDCINPYLYSFTDNSIGPDEWHWDFGDGTTSTTQHNLHTYADTGTYTIKLTVINHLTGCDDETTRTIRIVDEQADFYATDTVICKNTSTTFDAVNNTPGTITSYEWNFGDGQTGTGISTNHVYANAGLYTVTLIITDISGCRDTLTKVNYIRIDGPTAAFDIPARNCFNSIVNFTDRSTDDGIHPITTWVWNFGDGNIETFTAPPFTHLYTAPGTYNVNLKTIDAVGCTDSTLVLVPITISNPIAGFYRSDTIACAYVDISFNNTSTGINLSYLWNFGDGSTSSVVSPLHGYTTQGIFAVKLEITDDYGCIDTITKNIHIVQPAASFTVSDTLSTCPPLIATFTNTSVNANEATWDFGDGSTSNAANPIHIYNNPGIYFAKLFVTGPANNCFDTVVQRIVVRGPIGTFSYSPITGCSPLTVNFVAETQDRPAFTWDFNNGTTLNTMDSAVSFTYSAPGSYLPKMIMIDSGGCQIAIEGVDTINVYGVKANFGFDNRPLCDLGPVQFADSSLIQDASATYAWTFGDGGTSTNRNPTHFYNTPGQYFPQLVVTTNRGCVDTARLPVPVSIVASPQADINNASSGCTPVTANFQAFLVVPDTSAINWEWSLGNGNTSTLQNPPAQTYTTAQVYNVQLIATNSTGCKDTVNRSFEVYPIPVISAGLDRQICRGTPSSMLASGGATYAWSPATGLSCTNCAAPMASPDFDQKYFVTGTSAQGCSNSDSVFVTVIQPFVMENKPGDTICAGGSVRLFASGANSYMWSPSAGLSNVVSAVPNASPKVTTRYMVVGSDAYGCFKDTGYSTIKVYPIPKVDAGKDITIKNGAAPLVITPTISPDVTNTYWLTAPGILSSNAPSVTVQPKTTTEYTVEVRNPGGCKSVDKITIFVLCNDANIFIPNTFSPNGSGTNDIFYPRGSGIFKIKLLRIFNRWGEVVFERVNFSANDPNAGWDGTVKGKKVNSDVFVYTAELVCDNNTTMIVNGNVALLR